jgi:hypothetical protein
MYDHISISIYIYGEREREREEEERREREREGKREIEREEEGGRERGGSVERNGKNLGHLLVSASQQNACIVDKRKQIIKSQIWLEVWMQGNYFAISRM